MKVSTTDRWYRTFPGGHVGILQMNHIDNTAGSERLTEQKAQIEAALKGAYGGFSRQDLLSIDTLRAYRDYYKPFKKTYHLLLQIESIALKKKSIPSTTPLVDANFMAELDTFVLSAGHDVDRMGECLTIDSSGDDEAFIQMNGTRRMLKQGDMVMRDGPTPVCSIIYGQDRQTAISRQTRGVLFVAYAPRGVGAARVEYHLAKIEGFVRLFSSGARTVRTQIIQASIG